MTSVSAPRGVAIDSEQTRKVAKNLRPEAANMDQASSISFDRKALATNNIGIQKESSMLRQRPSSRLQ